MEDGIVKQGKLDADNMRNWLGSNSFQGNENVNPQDTFQLNGENSDIFKLLELKWVVPQL